VTDSTHQASRDARLHITRRLAVCMVAAAFAVYAVGVWFDLELVTVFAAVLLGYWVAVYLYARGLFD
jgi:uncharacterized membrane protein YjjP (DUF1212 family)